MKKYIYLILVFVIISQVANAVLWLGFKPGFQGIFIYPKNQNKLQVGQQYIFECRSYFSDGRIFNVTTNTDWSFNGINFETTFTESGSLNLTALEEGEGIISSVYYYVEEILNISTNIDDVVITNITENIITNKDFLKVTAEKKYEESYTADAWWSFTNVSDATRIYYHGGKLFASDGYKTLIINAATGEEIETRDYPTIGIDDEGNLYYSDSYDSSGDEDYIGRLYKNGTKILENDKIVWVHSYLEDGEIWKDVLDAECIAVTKNNPPEYLLSYYDFYDLTTIIFYDSILRMRLFDVVGNKKKQETWNIGVSYDNTDACTSWGETTQFILDNNGQPCFPYTFDKDNAEGETIKDIAGLWRMNNIFQNSYPNQADDLYIGGDAGEGNNQFIYPIWIEKDSDENIYVLDAGLKSMKKFNSSQEFVTTYKINEKSPSSLAVDENQNVYLLFKLKDEIRILKLKKL